MILKTPPQLEQDQGFQEFLAVHQNRTQAPTWANDTLAAGADPSGAREGQGKRKEAKTRAVSEDYLNFDSDQSEDMSPEEEEEEEEEREVEGQGECH